MSISEELVDVGIDARSKLSTAIAFGGGGRLSDPLISLAFPNETEYQVTRSGQPPETDSGSWTFNQSGLENFELEQAEGD